MCLQTVHKTTYGSGPGKVNLHNMVHRQPRGMKLSKQVYEISNLLEISSDEYH